MAEEEATKNPVAADGEAAEDEGGQDSGSPEARRLSARELLELRNAFTDIDTDESGYITAAELEEIFRSLELAISEEELASVVEELDRNKDDSISFDEFREWWAYDTPIGRQLKAKTKEKAFWVAPAMMAFHLFDQPHWFKYLGMAGMPFYITGEIITWVINVLIIISTGAFVFETDPSYSGDPHLNPTNYQDWEDLWKYTEWVCVFCFTIDISVRCVASIIIGKDQWKKFVNDSMNWVDVIAVFPFYLKFVVGLFSDVEVPDLRFVRVIRLARVLRSLPEKYASMGGVVSDIVSSAALGLLLPLYFMFLSMFVWASLVYYAEAPYSQKCYVDGAEINGDWNSAQLDADGKVTVGNEGCLLQYGCRCGCDAAAHAFAILHGKYLLAGETESDGLTGAATLVGQGSCNGEITFVTWDGGEHSSDMFDDGRPGGIGTAMWWCVVTFTTVGYGDMMPRTPQGQLFAVLTMVTGIFFLAMPLAVVGGAFTQAWAKAESNYLSKLAEREKERIRQLPDEERAQLPVHHVLKTSQELVDGMSDETQTRLDVLGYLERMKRMASSTVERCPPKALPEVRAAIAAFNDKLDVVAGMLNETPEWRPKQLKKVYETEEDAQNGIKAVVLWEDEDVDSLKVLSPGEE